MKRFISLSLATAIICCLFAGCQNTKNGEQNNAGIRDVTLWYGYNTESIMQDTDYTEKAKNRDYTLRMNGIRGDVESVQLIMTPEKDVTSFELIPGDLKNENGDIFSKQNIEVFMQWYVNVEGSYNTGSYGYYPDALIPMATAQKEALNHISANSNQGIWLNANIGQDTKPGHYTGTAELKLDGQTCAVPLELTVYDAVMPEEVHPRSCFLIWFHLLPEAEGSDSLAVIQGYYDLLVEKRCMPMYPAPEIYSDVDRFIQYNIDNVVNNPKISAYAIPYAYHTDENGERMLTESSVMEYLEKMAIKNVELRQKGDMTTNLFAKAYYYLGSIIDEPTGGRLQRVKECDLIISQSKFAVADKYLKEYPDLYNALAGLPHVVTTAYNEDLIGSDQEGGVQAWCPQFQHWHSEENRQKYHDRQNTTDRLMGEEAWWYGCNNPQAPFPTYHLDDDLIASRILSWMQYDYGSDGNLYWCINYPQEDMWENAHVIGGSAGEGNLTYPGAKFHLKHPLSTLRLESIREGVEDYEYFWLIEQAIIAFNRENGTNYDPQALMAPLYDGLYDGMIPKRDNGEGFQKSRLEVLRILELMTSDPAAGIVELEKNKK